MRIIIPQAPYLSHFRVSAHLYAVQFQVPKGRGRERDMGCTVPLKIMYARLTASHVGWTCICRMRTERGIPRACTSQSPTAVSWALNGMHATFSAEYCGIFSGRIAAWWTSCHTCWLSWVCRRIIQAATPCDDVTGSGEQTGPSIRCAMAAAPSCTIAVPGSSDRPYRIRRPPSIRHG